MVMVDKLTVPAHGQRIDCTGWLSPDARRREARNIAPGNTVHLQLHFSDGETLDAPFAVKPPAQAN